MGEIECTALTPAIGSLVKADPDALVRGAFADRLSAMLVERGVLVFRDLDITIEQQRAITATFGRLRTAGGEEGGVGGLQKVTLDSRESPEYAAFFPTTFFWHLDGPYDQTMPCFAASLRPARLPPEGGETEFLNAYAAYEDLPEADRALLDGLCVVHSAEASMSAANPDAPETEAARWRAIPRATQPLVWEHASGRKSLMLGGSVSHVEGMHPADSFDLLARLRCHMAQPRYVYTHVWRMGDLVLWDNSGTLHRVRPFDPGSGRLLNRFTVEGVEAIQGPARGALVS